MWEKRLLFGTALSAILALGAMMTAPAEAVADGECDEYSDWEEQDPFVFFDDHYHALSSAPDPEQQEPSGEWELQRNVNAEGDHHTSLQEKYTFETGGDDHAQCSGGT